MKAWPSSTRSEGDLTASSNPVHSVLHVKDEARSLPSSSRTAQIGEPVLIIDDGSSDGAPDVSVTSPLELGAPFAWTVVTYPSCHTGTDHLDAPADSVHSLTYF